GFAMQSIVQNFVAGVILLTERTIKPGDIVDVEGMVVKVLSMGIRASIVQSRDGEEVIIPNSLLSQNAVKNYTLRDSCYRVRLSVGVIYGSDMRAVRKTLESVAQDVSNRWGVPTKPPLVVMTGFGDNSVNWEIGVWMSDPFELKPALSELHESVWWAFREQDLVIAFPQLDVHFDEPIASSLAMLARNGG
ncbi:MAG: mechanosensitive ion channel, partial [Deltaproteobacteria bacterium]|nr:mechanosensitive ion channel [Deltaproteobacteria bacterium]